MLLGKLNVRNIGRYTKLNICDLCGEKITNIQGVQSIFGRPMLRNLFSFEKSYILNPDPNNFFF